MLRTLGIIEVCFAPARAKPSVARKLGGKSVLEWVVRRVTDCQQLDGVIVLTCDAPENRIVKELVPMDVPVFVASGDDAVDQYAAALEQYQAEAVVRVCPDHPFIDPMLIDRLIVDAEAHPGCDYVSYRLRDGRPAILSPVGMYAEWFRAGALRRAAREATAADDRRCVTRYLYSRPDVFTIRLIRPPSRMDRDDLRLRVDVEEDWDNTLAIYEALGPEELDWQRIADLLDHQPHLRSRMAVLNRTHCKG